MTYSDIWFIKFRSHLTGPNATALLQRHNGRDGISNHQPYACLLNRLFTRIKESIKVPHHWPPCGEFTGNRWTQMTSNTEDASIWWRHHANRAGFRIRIMWLNRLIEAECRSRSTMPALPPRSGWLPCSLPGGVSIWRCHPFSNDMNSTAQPNHWGRVKRIFVSNWGYH